MPIAMHLHGVLLCTPFNVIKHANVMILFESSFITAQMWDLLAT